MEYPDIYQNGMICLIDKYLESATREHGASGKQRGEVKMGHGERQTPDENQGTSG